MKNQNVELKPMEDLKYKVIMEIKSNLAPVVTIGEIGKGILRWVPIIGGTFEGPGHNGVELKGTVLPYGQDLQLIKPNGEWELDALYMLQTEQNEIILINSKVTRFGNSEDLINLRDGKPYNIDGIKGAGFTVFEVSSPRLQWMKHHTFFPLGKRYPNGVEVQICMLY